MMNICTDADPARKIVVHNYCNEELSELSPIYDVLSEIPLLDLCCGPFEETDSFDVKHIVKRCWCALINGKHSSTLAVTGLSKCFMFFPILYASDVLGSLFALHSILSRDGPPIFKTINARSLSSSEGLAR